MPTHYKDVPVKELSTYSQDSFEGGINMNSETAQPNQVIDSRNMWAPINLLESRPGKRPIGYVPINTEIEGGFTTITYQSGVYAAPASFPLTFNAAVGNIMYFKPGGIYPLIEHSGAQMTGDGISVNTAATRMTWEYWNGVAWVDLNAVKYTYLSSDQSYTVNPFYITSLAGNSNRVSWAMPADVTTTSVNGNSGYFLRMRITDTNSSLGSNTVTTVTALVKHTRSTTVFSRSLANIYWPGGGTTYMQASADTDGSNRTVYLTTSDTLAVFNKYYKAATSGLSFPNRAKLCYPTTDLTTLPEYGCAFYTYEGIVFDVYKNSMNQAPPTTATIYDYAAQVEDDLNIIGETKDLSRTFIPQESVYPHSSYVLWLNSYLFHARTTDNPYIVRWSAPSSFALKGYKVWPKASQTTVLGDDLSPIVGMKAFGEQPIVLKRQSMWRMVYVGPGDDNLGIWEAAKISGGVGTLSNSSVQITPAGMVHAYEDGIYVFDGVNSTKVGGDKIQEYWDSNINLTEPNAFVSAHWKSKHCYLLSMPTKDRAGQCNNKVLVWDYVDNAFWIWDNLVVVNFLPDTLNNTQDSMYFMSDDQVIYQLTGNTDNGTAIDSYITTHRFGYKDNKPKSMRQVYIGSTPESGQVLTSVITNDRDIISSGTMVFTDPKEPAAGTLLWNQGKFTSTTKRRFRHLNFRERGKWFQVKAEHNVNNKPFKLTQVQLGVYTPVEKIR